MPHRSECSEQLLHVDTPPVNHGRRGRRLTQAWDEPGAANYPA